MSIRRDLHHNLVTHVPGFQFPIRREEDLERLEYLVKSNPIVRHQYVSIQLIFRWWSLSVSWWVWFLCFWRWATWRPRNPVPCPLCSASGCSSPTKRWGGTTGTDWTVLGIRRGRWRTTTSSHPVCSVCTCSSTRINVWLMVMLRYYILQRLGTPTASVGRSSNLCSGSRSTKWTTVDTRSSAIGGKNLHARQCMIWFDLFLSFE